MRCSSCELDLDRYLEGTLPPPRMALVCAHLESCTSCAAMLMELRVVDALLATSQPAQPSANFTFAVMAEVRTMVIPKRPTWQRPLMLAAAYVMAVWIVAIVAFPQFTALWNAFTHSEGGARLTNAIAHIPHPAMLVSPQMFTLAVGALALDAVLVTVLVRRVRGARAFQIAAFEEHAP